MKRTELNKDTNSLYDIDEKQFLEDIGFSWSNKSHSSFKEGDNCLYRYYNGISQDTEVRTNSFNLTTHIPTHIGILTQQNSTKKFEEIKSNLKLSLKNKILFNIYKLNAIPFGLLWLLLMLIIFPFIKTMTKKEKIKTMKTKLKSVFTGSQNYFFLKDSLPFVWGLNLFILGASIVYLIK